MILVARLATPDPTNFGPMTKATFDADVLAREACRRTDALERLRREAERVARLLYLRQRDAWMNQQLRELGVVHTCEDPRLHPYVV